MAMGHRERVLKALNHEEPDRVPIDLGGTPVTQVHPDAYEALLSHIGFPPEKLDEGQQGSFQAVTPSEDVLRHFDADVRGVSLGLPDGRPNEELDPLSYRDEWGVVWRKAAPRAPFINVAGPFQGLQDPGPGELATIEWPDAEDTGRVRGLRRRAEALRNETDYAIVLNLGNTTFALGQRLRGFTELLEDLLINKAFAGALLERVTDIVCDIADNALRQVGDLVDCVFFADDLGIQTQSFMRPELYREMVKPHHRRLAEVVRRRTAARIILHSDGAVFSLLEDFVDCGIQVLNPVQTSAVGMDPGGLKREFGTDLSFWGGIDTQHVLPYGSPGEVELEVHRRLDDLGQGGGYVLGPVHNFQAEVSPENIVAMYEAAKAGPR